MATETLRINITADNKAAIGGITQVKNTVDGLTESIKVYQDKAFAEKDLAKLKVYNREIQALQAQLKQTTNVGKIGFDEMGVAIKGGSGAINKAFTGLRQIAYIIPGLGIAGIFNLAFEAIGSAAKQLDLFSSKEKDAAKAAAEFNKELLKQVETGAQEISHLKALESVASNSSLSIEKRKQAVKELRDQYPAYFKDLTDEEILTGKVTKVTDQLTNAIYKRAEARAREADIAKKATQVFANQQQIELLDLEIAKQKKIASERSVLKKVGTSGGVNEISGSDIQYQSESKLRDLQVERNKLYLETEGIKIDVEKDQRRINKLQGDTIQLGEKETKVLKDRRNPLEHEKKGAG